MVRQDCKDFLDCLIGMDRHIRIAPTAHHARTEQERLNLLAVKHQWWQLVAMRQAITHPCLTFNRYTRQAQRLDIAVNSALGYPKVFTHLLGGKHGAAVP